MDACANDAFVDCKTAGACFETWVAVMVLVWKQSCHRIGKHDALMDVRIQHVT